MDLFRKPSLLRAVCDKMSATPALHCKIKADKVSKPRKPNRSNIKHSRSIFSRNVLMHVIIASIKATHGAGGSSCSPSMSLPGFVHIESPAFQLLDENAWSYLHTSEDYCTHFEFTIQRIKEFFTQKKALRLNKYGDTLIHVSKSWILKPVFIICIESQKLYVARCFIIFVVMTNFAEASSGL